MTVVKETQLDTTESVVDTPAVEVEAPAAEVVDAPAAEVVDAPAAEVVDAPSAEAEAPAAEDPLPPVPAPKATVTLDIESKAIVETFVDAIEGDFDLNSVMELVPKLMKHVQTYGKLTGPQKKNLVIKMINHIIDITDTP